MSSRVVAIVQARMGSTRLPGKVLMDIAGTPMLVRHVERLQRASRVTEVVVATTLETADEAISALCGQRGWACYRGSEHDVLGRYAEASRAHAADTIVRTTADCPLIDAAVVDSVVAALVDAQPYCDYASNCWPGYSYPRGLDVEVLARTALERADREDTDPQTREHVTAYVLEHPEAFRLRGVALVPPCPALRWTVDTEDDLELMRRICGELGDHHLPWTAAWDVCKRHPEWLALNQHVRQKGVRDHG